MRYGASSQGTIKSGFAAAIARQKKNAAQRAIGYARRHAG